MATSHKPFQCAVFCKVAVPTGLGASRNAINVLAADFVTAIGQSAGTLSEICFAWIHGKPIFILKGCCGRWEQAIAGGVDHRASSVVHVCEDVDDLRRHVQAFLAGSKSERRS